MMRFSLYKSQSVAVCLRANNLVLFSILLFAVGLSNASYANDSKHLTDKYSTRLSLPTYVNLFVDKGFSALQYQQRIKEQMLALELADQHFVPTVSLSTQYGQQDKNLYLTQALDNQTTGFDSTISTNWRSPTGATLTLSVQQQHGALEGLTSLNVPESTQTNTTSTLAIDQPIIGGLWNNISKLPQVRAKHEWRLFETEGRLLRMNNIRTALLGYVEFQLYVDVTKILQDALEFAEFRTQATAQRYDEGQIVYSELLSAQLELHQRRAALEKSHDDMRLIQNRLGALIDTQRRIQLLPLKSIDSLLRCTKVQEEYVDRLLVHPELIMADLNREITSTQYQEHQYSLWPKVSLFYSQTFKDNAVTLNDRTESYGMKASFTPFNTTGKLGNLRISPQYETMRPLFRSTSYEPSTWKIN